MPRGSWLIRRPELRYTPQADHRRRNRRIDLAPEVTATLPSGRSLAEQPAQSSQSARDLLRRIVWLYIQASGAAVAVMFTLVLLGLDFDLQQWTIILVMMPFGFGLYVVPD